MNDPNLNSLLKWSIQNSEAGREDAPSADANPSRGLNAEALHQLMGGPSDADLMRNSMATILSPDVNIDNKIIAFDNFEQLVENLDNANNMESLGLWMPLTQQLQNEEPEMRRYAAWCIGTAVQNNPKGQERLLVLDALPGLVKMALHDKLPENRKKAVRALSSEIRNYQPGLDAVVKELPPDYQPQGKLDAGDMDAIDPMIDRLREQAKSATHVTG